MNSGAAAQGSTGRTGPQAGRTACLVVAVLMAAMLGLVAYDVVAGTGVKLPVPFRAGDDYGRVLARQRYQRNVSIYIGVAASDVASGRAEAIVTPTVLDSLADRPKDKFPGPDRSAFVPDFMTRASGAALEPTAYDAVLTPEQLAALGVSHTRRTYPWDVVAFIGQAPESRVVLYTDAGRQTIYVVPISASPLGGAR